MSPSSYLFYLLLFSVCLCLSLCAHTQLYHIFFYSKYLLLFFPPPK